MKTQHEQGEFRTHRGLIVLTTGAFLTAAFLSTGCGSTGSAGMAGLQPRHNILFEREIEQPEVALRHGGDRSVGENPVGNPVDPEAMTAVHNSWRSQVGVPDLKWSDKLAAAAQEWADTLKEDGCGFYHSHNGYGENLFISSALMYSDGRRELADVTPRDAIDSWGEEIKDYNYADNSCSGVCGHYTQVVWKETKEVGCARTVCDDKSQIWVCSYAPAGNLVGKRPY